MPVPPHDMTRGGGRTMNRSREAGRGRPRGQEPSELARETLRRAISHGEVRVGTLIDAVPGLLAEARQRRIAAEAPAADVFRAARAWMPRLAAVTALLVLAALLVPARKAGPSTPAPDETATLDRWLVTGKTPSQISDPVLDALVR